ncbi:uncharacterized protein LOC144910712 [Branchiostoma floridae x Branchiostoma belcheri]
MAVNYAVLLLLVLYSLLCRANESEGTNFTVSVPEDAKIGTDVVSLPRTEKAELPCVMVEGDPYSRFYVSNNCTVTVARPLDWSVQSEYRLKLRVGGSKETDYYIVRIRVNVRNVLGYPPVYNETCETPVNPSGNRTGEFLFSVLLNAQAETTAGGVLFFQKRINNPLEKRDREDLKVVIRENNYCEVHIVTGVHHLHDLSTALEIWETAAREDFHKVTISCHAETALQSELSISLFDVRELYIHDLPYLDQLQVAIPQVMERLLHPRFVYYVSFHSPAKTRTHYICKLPKPLRPTIISLSHRNQIRVRYPPLVTLDFIPIGCPPDRYGLLCDQNCICKNGARCHGFNGACKCTDAWQGVVCDIPKPGVSAATTPSDPSDIYISADVTVHCKVHHVNATALSLRLPNGSEIVRKNSSRLEQTLLNIQPKDDGPYMCQVWDTNGRVFNATVVLDIAKCPPNRKGEFCDETCDCLYGATCDWRSGCVCPPGWTGDRCQTTCPNGTYGQRCREKCRCRNGAICRPSDGRCTCTAGWYGWQCDVPCPEYRHGLRCQQVCTCKNNATCHNVDGSCTCVAPWTGKNCDQVEEQEQAMRPEQLLEIFVPIGSFIVLAACVGIILYKKRHLCGVQPGEDDETEAFLELEQVEADLAQTVQPGWLSRWGKTRRHLTLGHLVGMGMFGQVIQAKLKTHAGDITVAAKEVRRRDIQCYRNFYREAAILVAVHEDQHHDNLRSNIIQLLGFINEPTHKYILTEYASNGNLFRLLRQARRQGGSQSLPRHLRYAVHIARALQELQRLALTHRDVAARNVLITADHVAKLADFGQARDVYTAVQYVPNDKHGIEQPAKPKDKVKNEVFPLIWTALESLETGEYTCQSDVWSFGVLLWEIVTMGQEPRYHGNDQPTCQQLARTLRRGIRLRRPPGSSGEMYDVMMSCWQEMPSERPDPDEVEMKLLQLRNAMITVRETTKCQRYGFLCDQNCICKNGARCHGFNGACKCTGAWQGVACDIPKPGVSATTTPSDPSDVYISANVTVHCKVHHVKATKLSLRLPNGSEIVIKNSSRLDQTLLNIQPKDNGPYMCKVWDAYGKVFNATVVLDIAKCPPNRKGQFCDETCDCLHGASCDWTSGCVCPAGWTGTRCQTTCPNGTYGERCREKCRCRNGASCSPRDGRCTCAAGWYGWQCDVPCPQYRYGLRCQQVCTCKNNATCHNVDGTCTCVAPWTGNNCDQVKEQEQPLLQIFVPIGSVIVLAVCVGAILYKKRRLCGVQAGQDDETEAFLELEQVEADLAQTVRPGWLSRWGKTRWHLTLGPLVGMGMFGQVMEAKLKTPAGDITVAAKEVRRRDIQCYRNFYIEAAILVAVHEDQHHDNLRSNIIQLLGFINESTDKYILMEYATNGNLLRLLRQARRQDGPQSLPRHLRYAVHIARALQELQRLALTHRDVAARNVLITAHHVAKLADFGQARDVYTAVQYVPYDGQPAKPKDNVKNEVFPLNWTALESLETGIKEEWRSAVSWKHKFIISIIYKSGYTMSVNYAVLLLLVLYCLLCRADEFEPTNFTVSVAEDAKIGTDVLSLPRLLGTEKAELPCVMVEGDPYGRFYVSNNCTVTVARSLDWSVQSEYILKFLVGGQEDPDHHVVRIRVNVRNVLGYPPVYNETCETPVNPRGNLTGEFLFSLSPSVEAETTEGDVLFFQKSISKPLQKWDMDNLKVIITGTDNCEVRYAFGISHLNDLWAASEIWQSFYRGEDGTVTLSCHAETAFIQSELSIMLLDIREFYLHGDLPYLEQLEIAVPQVLEKLQHSLFIYFLSFNVSTNSRMHYRCKLPIQHRPLSFFKDKDHSVTLINVRHVETLTMDLSPIGCAPDRYGLLCDQNCICKNGARCHGFNGACKCTDAWQGVACDIPKPGVSAATTPSDPSDIYISANVTVHCKVHHVKATALSLRLPNGSEIVRKNLSRLDQTLLNIQPKDNGPYMCKVWGTYGKVFNATVVLDIAKCPPNRKGEFCDETCDCLHGASCDWTSGCVCPPGWTGTRCQTTCPNGTYGERCREECRCRNGASCSPSDGRCTCAAGWYGWQCDVPCPKYRHGLRCQQVCTCKNNATCHNVDGSCTCVAPWTGKNCDQVVEQEQVMRPEPLLEIFVPIGSVVALAACVGTILYKKRHLCGVQAGQDDETEAFLELEQVEADLAQTVRRAGSADGAKLKTPAGDITVAAKEVRRRDIQCYRNFYREAAILVAVHEDQHHDNLRSNIIQLLGFINEPTHKYILTEYASNGNLLRLLRQARRQGGSQSLPRHLRYAVHIARALQELQRLALTHRDVAARNVLITADHVAKLADFGQARDVYTAVQYVTNDKHGMEQPDKPKDNVKNEVFPLNWTALESLETARTDPPEGNPAQKTSGMFRRDV